MVIIKLSQILAYFGDYVYLFTNDLERCNIHKLKIPLCQLNMFDFIFRLILFFYVLSISHLTKLRQNLFLDYF